MITYHTLIWYIYDKLCYTLYDKLYDTYVRTYKISCVICVWEVIRKLIIQVIWLIIIEVIRYIYEGGTGYMKWEYKKVKGLRQLNKYGLEGWRLVPTSLGGYLIEREVK